MATQRSTPAASTQADLRPLMTWIEVLGKALITKGVLSKEDLVMQLSERAASGGPAAEAEMERMIMQIDTW